MGGEEVGCMNGGGGGGTTTGGRGKERAREDPIEKYENAREE